MTNLDMFGDDLIDATPEQVLDAMERPEVKKGLQTLANMLDVAEVALVREGFPKDQARKYAAVAVRGIAWWVGGKTVYMPHGKLLETALRDNAMWNDFTGDNIEELREKYGIDTTHAVYRIIRQQREFHTKKIQPSLDVDTEQ